MRRGEPGMRSLSARAMLACVALAASSACVPQQTMPGAQAGSEAIDRAQRESRAALLLAEARVALAEIEQPASWVSAAGEYALALAAAGEGEEARDVLDAAFDASAGIAEPAARLAALTQTSTTAAQIGSVEQLARFAGAANAVARALEDPARAADAHASLAALPAAQGAYERALEQAAALPQNDDTLAAYKARTYREIADYAGERADFDMARRAIGAGTMGMAYYGSVARAEVARHAFAAGRARLARELLEEAQQRVGDETDGYFAAGALRDIAIAWAEGGDPARALRLFAEAARLARTAEGPQQQARALSRVATGMADAGLEQEARELLPQAREIARTEPSETMRSFSLYEIAGSAAFTGDLETATSVASDIPDTPFGSATSLRAATMRDLAWGEARHGEYETALLRARAIGLARERVQALSRLVRLLYEPRMHALPRYL